MIESSKFFIDTFFYYWLFRIIKDIIHVIQVNDLDVIIWVGHVSLIDCHLLLPLLSIVFSHRSWINCKSNSIEVKHCFSAWSDLCVSILSPVCSPSVLNNPCALSIWCVLPADYLDDMVSIKFESVVRPGIDTLFIGEEISVRGHLSKDWSICKNFFLDTGNLCC